MSHMSKQKKNMLILLLVLIVFVIINAAAQLITSSNEAKQEEEASKLAQESVIYIEHPDDITEIKIENTDASLTFKYSEADGQWSSVEYPDCPINQTTMGTFKNLLLNMTAEREFDSPDSLDSYGLSSPAATITVTDGNSQKTVYSAGDLVSSGYYFMQSDSDNVYIMDSTQIYPAFYDLSDFIMVEAMPDILDGKLNYFYAASQDASVEMKLSDDEWHYTSDELKDEALNQTAVNNIIYAFSDIAYSSCVGYITDSEAYTTYGLDNPYLTYTLEYTDDDGANQKITVNMGNLTSDSTYRYFIKEGSDIVLTVKETLVQEIVNYITYNYADDTSSEVVVTEITD